MSSLFHQNGLLQRASAAECAAHEAVLDAIAKATKGGCLWRADAEPSA